MNEKFYDLPAEKQQRIVNAGYRVFGYNSYKKSPVSEIAEEAGISKSLLFYYFKNKKELYLFLWEQATKLTVEKMKEYRCYEQEDIFEMMKRGMTAKLDIMRVYPDMAAFTIRAFYEKEPEVRIMIQRSYMELAKVSAAPIFEQVDGDYFREGLDPKLIHQEMRWASTGYIWETMQQGTIDVEKLEQGFTELLEFWRRAYCREKEDVST